jgi:uncharacterized membrane protein
VNQPIHREQLYNVTTFAGVNDVTLFRNCATHLPACNYKFIVKNSAAKLSPYKIINLKTNSMINEMNHGWGMGYRWLFTIFIPVGVIILMAVILNQKKKQNRKKYKSPLEIINERFAKGEIKKED